MKRETEMFFNDLVRRDRQLPELLHRRLHVRERTPGAALRHPEGRRQPVPPRRPIPTPRRRGILGQGSVLVQTSLANRTSPVLRGKWVMEVLLGTPPPPPPPNVPALEETGEAKDGKLLTTRERMEVHRANPTCNACHRFMDPIGLVARQLRRDRPVARARERHAARHARRLLRRHRRSTTSTELSAALLKRPEPLVRNFTENLMAYALGRRVETFDQPTVRAIAKKAAADGYPDVVVHPGRRQERCVPEEERRPGSDDDRGRARTPASSDSQSTLPRRFAMSFITGKQLPRRTFLRGAGATVALPFLDAMVPAGRVLAKAARAHAARVHRGSAWPRGLQRLGRHAAPVRPGDHRAATSSWCTTTPLKSLEPVPRPPHHHQQHRRAHGRGVRAARDRRRSLPLERGVPDAVASRSRRRAPTSGAAPRSTSSTPSSSGSPRRCRRCSSASRTSTRPAAAPTTTRAPTPTRSAGPRRTTRCR